jgi:hypothetical protein
MKPTTIFALTLLAAVTALAQNDTSWVSHTGSDSNSCTLAAPCLTFQGAYATTNINGIVKALDAGEYGPVSITQAITIDGNGVGAVILATAGNGVTVNTPNPVAIRNLSIYVSGSFSFDGILVPSGNVTVENVSILGAPQAGVEIDGGTATVHGFTVTGAQYGIYVANAAAVIDDSVVRYASIGIRVVGISAVTHATIERSQMIGSNTGLWVTNFGAATTARISDNVISANATGTTATGGGQIITFRNNTWAANTADGSTPFSVSLK